MGIFSKSKESAEAAEQQFIQSLLVPGETIELFEKAAMDWAVVTNKRVIIKDTELKLLGDSSDEIISYNRSDVRTMVIDIPISGILKKYRISFRSGHDSCKITYYDKGLCLLGYARLAELIYK